MVTPVEVFFNKLLSQTKRYSYAADGALTAITYLNARTPTPNVTFAYDSAYPRRTSMIDGTGTTLYAYYPVNGQLGAGRLRSVTSAVPAVTITYRYDELGRRSGRSIGSGNDQTLTFDALGRVVAEVNPLGRFASSYVGATGRAAAIEYPNRQRTAYQYLDIDGDFRLKEIANQGPDGAVLSKFNYTYDAEGQILTWSQQLGPQAPNQHSLGHDAAGQLISATVTGSKPKRFGYSYDAAGNRTSESIDAVTAIEGSNQLNQITTKTGTTPRSYGYDANGNMISNNGIGRSARNYLYSWDAENRLIRIEYPGTGQRTMFTYDGLGRLVRISEVQGSLPNTRSFAWDGDSIAQEHDDSTGLAITRYFSGGVQDRGVALFYARDHLTTIRTLTDSRGTAISQIDYDLWGRRNVSGDDRGLARGFTGHVFHTPSGLTLTRHRLLDTTMGRWLSRDPLGEAAGANLYGYVDSRVVYDRDDLGLKPRQGQSLLDPCDPWTWLAEWLLFTRMEDDGKYYLVAHGPQKTVGVVDYRAGKDGRRVLNARDTAKVIHDDPAYSVRPGCDVYLFVCGAARNGFAADVSAELQKLDNLPSPPKVWATPEHYRPLTGEGYDKFKPYGGVR